MEIRNHYLEDLIFEPLRLYFTFSLGLFISFLLLRGYEYSAFSQEHSLPDNWGQLFLTGNLADLLFTLQVSIVLLPLFGLTHYISFQTGQRYKVFFSSFLFILALAIEQYFVTASVPLGSDFWGYSWSDIKTTVGSSTSFGVTTIIVFVLVLFLLMSFLKLLNRFEIKNKPFNVVYLIALLASLFYGQDQVTNRANFKSEEEYHLALNKPAFFVTKSINLFVESLQGNASLGVEGGDKADYPLMKKVLYNDILGEYFNTSTEMPNLVFIQVEGLGKVFVGENAPKGGFTPFLDSLSKHALHWENFLSSAGRTFGILPSLYGSLPYGTDGFMELGDKMPNHTSLITMLKKQGYYTTFYYGGNANFDAQDVFLERQGIDNIVSQNDFPSSYTKMKENSGGFTWGYGDKDVFKLSHALEEKIPKYPRLDIFMTLTTHEPFVVPEAKYKTLFTKYAAKSNVDTEILTKYRGVFECLLYTDDAIKDYIAAYSKRPEYKNTIFIITGDHRMIPVPHENAIDRFHVPFIIWSPMLKQGAAFKGVGTHHNVAATFIGFLSQRYHLRFPSELPFIGGVLDNSKTFRSKVDQGIMRNKNDLSCYVYNDYYLSDGAAFKISDGMNLSALNNEKTRKILNDRLENFRRINKLVCEKNRLFSGKSNQVSLAAYTLTEKEIKFLKANNYHSLGVDDQFYKARDLAFAGNYDNARVLLKNVLNGSPNYSDVRILMARTYMWQGKYEVARKELKEAIRRSPTYYDCYVAIIDCELYAEQKDSAKYWYDEGLKTADNTVPIKEKQKSIQ